ncbi:MAG: inorganic phosphate transporter [Desulfohalobiaceae bacterium]
MSLYDLFFFLSLAGGFLMAFNLGANDVANSMASAVGARAITVRQAVYIAGTLTFVGAVFLGAQVTSTVSKGIINPDQIAEPQIMMVGMFAALLSATLWVFIATLTALPVSSTHSIVGSILGFGLVAGGMDVVNWLVLLGVVMSWFLSPFLAASISFLIFTHIRKFILFRPQFLMHALYWAPVWIGLTFCLVGLSFIYKTPVGDKIPFNDWINLFLVFVMAILVWRVSKRLLSKVLGNKEDTAENVELIFRRLQIMTSSYMALSLGANDVANAVGPVAAIYMIAREQEFLAQAEVPTYILALGGLGIALGVMTFGYKVIATVGRRITTLNNTRGFSVDFGAATTVLAASNLGLPVSTTHAAVGGVVGVGLARGFEAVDFRVLGRIIVYWVLTVPIAGFTCMIIYNLLHWIFL